MKKLLLKKRLIISLLYCAALSALPLQASSSTTPQTTSNSSITPFTGLNTSRQEEKKTAQQKRKVRSDAYKQHLKDEQAKREAEEKKYLEDQYAKKKPRLQKQSSERANKSTSH